MKIITPGQLPGDKVHKATCHSCRCVFEFKQSEGTIHNGSYSGSTISVSCPQEGCGRTVSVDLTPRSYGYMDR